MQGHVERLEAELRHSEEENQAVRQELAKLSQEMTVQEADASAAKGTYLGIPRIPPSHSLNIEACDAKI